MMLEYIAKDMANVVKSAVADVEKKLTARIKELEEKISSRDSLEEFISSQVSKAISEIELPKGEEGKSISIDDVLPLIEDAVSSLELPKGDDGVSPSADEVAQSMEGMFHKWALGFERKADSVLEKAAEKLRQPEDGKDGRDAIQLEDFDISILDDGRTIKMSLIRGDDVVEKTVKIPSILDKGVYRDGNKYEKGDAVTYGGCLWIAQKNEPEGKPSASDDWRLSVKRGRDGRESVKVERDVSRVGVKDGNAGKPK